MLSVGRAVIVDPKAMAGSGAESKVPGTKKSASGAKNPTTFAWNNGEVRAAPIDMAVRTVDGIYSGGSEILFCE